MGKQVGEFLIKIFYRYDKINDQGIMKIGRALKTLDCLKRVEYYFTSKTLTHIEFLTFE